MNRDGEAPTDGWAGSRQAKAKLRAEARARLRAISPEARALSGKQIEEHLWTVPEVSAARSILLFASMPSEVPTDSIAAAARRRGIRVVYPRCLPGTALALHEVADPDRLIDNGSYGIREPSADCPVTSLDDIDVAFVPGLAWDATGARLGRGAGYYDRLFDGSKSGDGPLRLGLFFGAQRLEAIPMDPWDAPLDVIVSEDGVWRV